MRVYVELIYTIAVEVGHDEHEATTDDELIEACRNDEDFAYRISNGPHALFEVDWRIADLWDHTRKHYDAMPVTGIGHQVASGIA